MSTRRPYFIAPIFRVDWRDVRALQCGAGPYFSFTHVAKVCNAARESGLGCVVIRLPTNHTDPVNPSSREVVHAKLSPIAQAAA